MEHNSKNIPACPFFGTAAAEALDILSSISKTLTSKFWLGGKNMYERSKQIDCFHIRGFQYWDGALVVSQMKVGDALEIQAEDDNPHDPDAVALYFEGSKLGYVPASNNAFLAQLLYFGHTDVVEARVLQVDLDEGPWNQVRVGLFIKDAREFSFED